MLPSDKQQQQQQQQQQQHKGIIDISTIHNVIVEERSAHQNKIVGEQDKNNSNDDRVVGIHETSGLEKARRLRAVLGSEARRVRALRLRMRSSSAKSSSSGARSSSTEKIIANTARLLSKYSSQEENKEVFIEPVELGIESSLLSGHTMALSPSSSLKSGDNNNNNNNNDNSTTITDMMVLSSAETTQVEITKEMTLLFESSGQASIELVDSGCDIVKAALHSIEVFLMGPTTTTNKESAEAYHNTQAITTTNQMQIAPTRINVDPRDSVRIRLQKEALSFYS